MSHTHTRCRSWANYSSGMTPPSGSLLTQAVACRLPVRVEAFAVAAGAPAVSGVDGVPVVVAVGGVAVGADSGVVVEPSLVNLGEPERGPQRPGDLAGPDGV